MERRERQTGTGECSPPLASPSNLAGHPVQAAPLPEASRSPLVLRCPLSGGRRPRPERVGLRCSRRGCTPPAAAFADGGVRPAELPVLSAARPVCGSAELRRRVLRGRGRPLGGCRALGGGRPGAASSSAAGAAASSQCSVSREPRLVEAEPLGSVATSSSRCRRTSAWRSESCEPPADGLRTEPPFSAFPAVLTAPSPRPSCSLPFLSPSENGSCCLAR